MMVATAWLIFSCGGDEEKCAFIPVPEKKAAIRFLSLSDSLPAITSKAELVDLLTRYPVLRDDFFHRSSYPNDSVFINELFRRFTNPHLDTLLFEVRRVFGDEQNLKREFEQAYTNLLYYYPDAEIPRIITAISGLDTDMVVTDSLIIIGLDFYLGKGARYRPNMYEYLLRQYTPHNIVPSVMLLNGISDKFNATDPTDKTILADMMAYGKSFYFAKHMLPCVPDSIFIWYSSEEIKGANENQDLIWYRFIEDQVLYSTSHLVKQRYLGDRPKTIEVGDECPGRIAQWVGWEIVKSYMKSHPQITLQQLMQFADADKLFKESKYKPVKH
ncbi:MAG: gliding motility lipoprotein GldB [Cyclobacteriaceae bacterium]